MLLLLERVFSKKVVKPNVFKTAHQTCNFSVHAPHANALSTSMSTGTLHKIQIVKDLTITMALTMTTTHTQTKRSNNELNMPTDDDVENI